MNSLPLDGIKVIDFSQFLSGPLASLRLADLGAEVVKVEREGVGDICRSLYLSRETFDGDSTLFHSINRNKLSIEIDLKQPEHHERVMELISESDILIQNFRPGVLKKYGLDFVSLTEKFPALIYGSVSGYGSDPQSPYFYLPGQDLLAQSLSGMVTELTAGTRVQGLAIADMLAGNQLVEGILAALFHKSKTGLGALIEVSLLESLLDSMAPQLGYLLNGLGKPSNEKHCWVVQINSEPYLINIEANALHNLITRSDILIEKFDRTNRFAVLNARQKDWKSVILKDIEALGLCVEVKNWDFLFDTKLPYRQLLTQEIELSDGGTLTGTRLPIRFDGQVLRSKIPSPKIGQHTDKIIFERRK